MATTEAWSQTESFHDHQAVIARDQMCSICVCLLEGGCY
eukprot:COSAG02_NODE_66535_length_255_cov_0.660256_1_plen_38_part_01